MLFFISIYCIGFFWVTSKNQYCLSELLLFQIFHVISNVVIKKRFVQLNSNCNTRATASEDEMSKVET